MTRTRFLPLRLILQGFFQSRALLAASLGHSSVDLFAGMMPLILLLQKDVLALSYAQIGLVSMAFSLASSITQPFFGWLGDRWGHGRLMFLGVVASAPTITAMLAVDRFIFLLLLSVLAGFAAGAFHPQGAALAAQTSVERRGSAVSVFMLGGNLGYSFGPLFATLALAVGGSSMPLLLGLVGLVPAFIVYRLARGSEPVQRTIRRISEPSPARAALSLIITVTLIVFLRSWVQTSISTYIPQLIKAQGASTAVAGNVLFSILFPLALGGLIGGTLSDRVGRRRVLLVSTALIGPSLWGLLHSQGFVPYLIGPVLGVAIGASVPVSIVMTQELVPRGLGFMSGIAMGLNFISGAIGVWVTGIAADQIGLASALSFSAFIPVGAAVLTLLLPPDRDRFISTSGDLVAISGE